MMRMCLSPRCPPPIDSLADLPLQPDIVQRFRQSDPLLPFQRRIIPIIYAGLNVLCLEETRAGWCAAYMIPTLSRLVPPPSRTPDVQPSLVILTPTRELAFGVYYEIKRFIGNIGLKCFVACGGFTIDTQAKQLAQGCDVLVGTPGRLLDLVARGALSLASVSCVVMEEAHRTLDLGFGSQVRAHFASLPRTAQIVVLASVLTEELNDFLDGSVPPNYLIVSRPLTDKLV